eukprot:4022592-Prorocentrum_lima.AAC.1
MGTPMWGESGSPHWLHIVSQARDTASRMAEIDTQARSSAGGRASTQVEQMPIPPGASNMENLLW